MQTFKIAEDFLRGQGVFFIVRWRQEELKLNQRERKRTFPWWKGAQELGRDEQVFLASSLLCIHLK